MILLCLRIYNILRKGNYSFLRYIEHKEFDRSNRTSLFSFSHFDFHNLINTYESLLGKENVHVYLFEDFISDQKSFISSFIKNHNLQIDIEKIDLLEIIIRIHILVCFFARIINSFTRKNVLYKYYIIHLPFIYEYF